MNSTAQQQQQPPPSPWLEMQTADGLPVRCVLLRTRAPYDVEGMQAFLTAHAVGGRDSISPASDDTQAASVTSHALDVPGGIAVSHIYWAAVQQNDEHTYIPVRIHSPNPADEPHAIAHLRRMLDLDADPTQIAEALSRDARLSSLVSMRPGLRLPGARNPQEFALGVVLGQQVSLAAARTLQGRLATAFASSTSGCAGAGCTDCTDGANCADGRVDDVASGYHSSGGAASQPQVGKGESPIFRFLGAPDVSRIAETATADLRALIGLTAARAETLRSVAQALTDGLDLGPGADQQLARVQLAALRGIGPWSVELIAMRALGDPDAYPAGDLILRRALDTRTDRETRLAAEAWQPYRGYATQHLWADFLAAQAKRSAKT